MTLLAALAAGCDKVEPRTQVMLIVDADQDVRGMTRSLKVEIAGGVEGSAAAADTNYLQSFDGTGWPYRFALTPRSGERGRRYKIVLTAVGDSDKTVSIVRREGGFVQGKTLALVVHFEASCLGKSLRCTDSETCDDGYCVPAALDAKTLPGLFEIDGGTLPTTGTTNQGVSASGSSGSAAGSGGTGGSTGASGTGITTGVSECGDGMLGPGEQCDNGITSGQGSCPTQCTPTKACESMRLEGSGCQARCVAATITARVPDDNCCPDGADSTNDPDCTARCGNGLIEMGETCDPIASCPTPATCVPANRCLRPMVGGSAELCTATCTMQAITQCVPDDGCCPSGCTRANDTDCSASCGDGAIDPLRETCESASTTQPCPTSCDDRNACSLDVLTGSAANCNAACTHLTIATPFPLDGCCPQGANANNDTDCPPMCGNGVVERGERCDGVCPRDEAACNDNDSCTRDAVSGRDCQSQCTHQAIGANASAADGCCPAGANANTDRDCPATCGNGVVEPGERCDGSSCPTNCNDNVACTADFVDGAGCQRTCGHRDLGPNKDTKDGCCPSGLTQDMDADCAPAPPMCGNGKIETQVGETCDPDATCPKPACEDNDACTTDKIEGAPCRTKECTHTPIPNCCPPGMDKWQDPDCDPRCGNGHVEAPEECDSEESCAPTTSCDDNDPCTSDGVGTALPCKKKQCTHAPISRCCPPGTDKWQDPDCPAKCGNGHVEAPEEDCDSNAATCVECRTVVVPPPTDGGLIP